MRKAPSRGQMLAAIREQMQDCLYSIEGALYYCGPDGWWGTTKQAEETWSTQRYLLSECLETLDVVLAVPWYRWVWQWLTGKPAADFRFMLTAGMTFAFTGPATDEQTAPTEAKP